MTERKFHIPALIIAAAGAVLQFFCFPIGGLIAGITGLVLSLVKRKTHRTLLSLVLSIAAILGSIAWFVIWGINGDRGYWLFALFAK